MGLKPNELEKLQVHEIDTMFEGYKIKRDRQNALTSYFAYWLVAPHVKKNSVSPEIILKPLTEKRSKTRNELLREKEHFNKLLLKGGEENEKE